MLIELHGEDHLNNIVPEQYRNRHSEYIRENADVILSAICGDGSKRSHQDNRGFSWERDTRGYVSSFSLDKSHTIKSGFFVHRIPRNRVFRGKLLRYSLPNMCNPAPSN